MRLTILGATGSIGLSTIDVVAKHPDRFTVFALTANTNVNGMATLCERIKPAYAVMSDETAAQQLKDKLIAMKLPTEVLSGEEGLTWVAAHENVDAVMAAIVGAAGLTPTLSAVKAGKRILLANKESLVMSGAIFMEEVVRSGATLLPIDSEHNAIYQCLPDSYRCGNALRQVKRVLLTASGGPFRKMSAAQLANVTPAQACAHPNWDMGRKISVDSATLMNKGLELIEACWLFHLTPDDVDVHVHPQSIIHSMVEYVDGSILAQMGSPDMRTPIAYGLSWPERITSGVKSLDLFTMGSLDFEPPDTSRFPCLRLAADAFNAGGVSPAVLNAANEVAVSAFLEDKVRFTQIPQIVEEALSQVASPFDHQGDTQARLTQIFDADRAARDFAQAWVAKGCSAQ